MSKSIWHRYDETPKRQDIIMTDTGCWTYIADLFALEPELKRTRKALEIAVDALKLFDSGQYTPQPDSYGLKTDASRLARKTLEQITALEQKEAK